MSDTLIDGKINTVISGTGAKKVQLVDALDRLEREKIILYDIHVSSDSIMSCYVRDMKDCHIHFVDGPEGDYTMPAKLMKPKLATTANNTSGVKSSL